VIEFSSDAIEELQRRIAAELGYELVRHRLELYGRKKQPARKGRKESFSRAGGGFSRR
jgi:Fur family ferric uptake transcriptional regulator